MKLWTIRYLVPGEGYRTLTIPGENKRDALADAADRLPYSVKDVTANRADGGHIPAMRSLARTLSADATLAVQRDYGHPLAIARKGLRTMRTRSASPGFPLPIHLVDSGDILGEMFTHNPTDPLHADAIRHAFRSVSRMASRSPSILLLRVKRMVGVNRPDLVGESASVSAMRRGRLAKRRSATLAWLDTPDGGAKRRSAAYRWLSDTVRNCRSTTHETPLDILVKREDTYLADGYYRDPAWQIRAHAKRTLAREYLRAMPRTIPTPESVVGDSRYDPAPRPKRHPAQYLKATRIPA